MATNTSSGSGEPGIPDLTGVSLVLDTNVLLEIVSIDLIQQSVKHETPKALRESRDFRNRQRRARYSNLLAHHFSKHGIVTISLEDEATAILTGKIAPLDGGPAEKLTQIIVNHVLPGPLSGWERRVVSDDEHSPKGTNADRWLVRIAKKGGIPLISNEGVTPDGIQDRSGKNKNLRWRGKAEGVQVLAPYEYLRSRGIDCEQEAQRFVAETDECLSRALQTGALPGKHAAKAKQLLMNTYRCILLDEVDDTTKAIVPPTIRWDK